MPDPTDAELDEWLLRLPAAHKSYEYRQWVKWLPLDAAFRLAKALRACRQRVKTAETGWFEARKDVAKYAAGCVKLKQQSEAKDAVVRAAREGRSSIRAFLDCFNPHELSEDKGRQWIATDEMLDRINDALAAHDKEVDDGCPLGPPPEREPDDAG
jgi:hypothetical protein